MRSIVITGASSGIGRALALHFSARGVRLALIGRNETRLQEVRAECERRGASVTAIGIDVRERGELARHLLAFARELPVDLLIANAGVIAGSPEDGALEAPDHAYALLEINLLGAMNAVHPLLPQMVARGEGQIVLISSVAAFVPVPHAPSYAASKAALLSYGRSLRDLVAERGVKVNVVCPGYIETAMSKREVGKKPSLMSADRAAAEIARGIARDQAVITFPKLFAWSTRLSAILPERLRRRVAKPFRFSVPDES